MTYRVELPVFSGPMDLLLHLVKQQEVDIHEVMLSTVLDQYLAHLDVLETLDLADLGDFVVMASTLMEIKSRELLPREEVDLDEDLNPRDDLIRRLLEYKRYRDISRRLARMLERQNQMTEPVVAVPKGVFNGDAEEKTFDLGNIEIWDLTEAFARLLEETGFDKELTFDVVRRTVDYYAGQILERVKGAGEVDFEELFERNLGRYELIGVFTAMLEMMKQGYLGAQQDDVSRQIRVVYMGSADLTIDEILRGAGVVGDEAEAEREAVAEGEAEGEHEAAADSPGSASSSSA